MADFNRDGRLDLAIADCHADRVVIALGSPHGGWRCAASYPASQPVAIAVADFDGDARPDLAVCNAGTDTVAVLLGRGDGSFQPGTTLTCDRPLALAVASLSGDGRPCLVVVGGGGLRVFRSRGDGTFERGDLSPLGVDLLPGAGSADPTPGEPRSLGSLTPWERQVAELVGRGYSTAEIAAELFISPRTVESHVANLLGRLELRSRRQLVRLAAQALRYSGSLISILWASDCMGVVERVPGLA